MSLALVYFRGQLAPQHLRISRIRAMAEFSVTSFALLGVLKLAHRSDIKQATCISGPLVNASPLYWKLGLSSCYDKLKGFILELENYTDSV